MALICEFMAPIGTGKSTLINAICSYSKHYKNIFTSAENLKKENSDRGFLNLFKKNKYNKTINLNKFKDQIGIKYKEFPIIFLESLMKNKLNKNGFNYINKRFYRGIENIAEIEYYKSLENIELILIEDNFIRYSDILEISQLEYEDLKFFSKMIPIPDIIIFLELDISINLERLIKRTETRLNRKLIQCEIDERYNTLKMLYNLHKLYFEFLIKEYQIEYLKIDASNKTKDNRDKILDFLLDKSSKNFK